MPFLIFLLIFSNFLPNLITIKDTGILQLFSLLSLFSIIAANLILKRRKIRIESYLYIYFVFFVYTMVYHQKTMLGITLGIGIIFALHNINILKYINSLKIGLTSLFILMSIFIITNIIQSQDISFLRHVNSKTPLTELTSLHNSNVFARTILVSIPIYFILFSKRKINKLLSYSLYFLIFSVVIVSVSRANIIAITMFFIFYLGRNNIGKIIKNISLFAITFLLIFSFIPKNSQVLHHVSRVGEIYSQITENIGDPNIDANNLSENRARMYALSIHIWQKNPVFGLGSNSRELFSASGMGNTVDGKTKAIHGGLLSILVQYGVVGLLLFLYLKYSIIRYLIKKNTIFGCVNISFVGITFILSAFISQIGANIYNMTFYWVSLGLVLSVVRYNNAN